MFVHSGAIKISKGGGHNAWRYEIILYSTPFFSKKGVEKSFQEILLGLDEGGGLNVPPTQKDLYIYNTRLIFVLLHHYNT